MSEYTVKWIIQLDAEDHRAAAEEARRILDDPESLATVFQVLAEGGDCYVYVDIENPEAERALEKTEYDAEFHCLGNGEYDLGELQNILASNYSGKQELAVKYLGEALDDAAKAAYKYGYEACENDQEVAQ